MTSRRTLDTAILIAATALTRFVFRSHYLYDVDSVNFALALQRFDPSVHQPHPPGYFLYVCLGRLANLLFHDANAALVGISIVFSCGAVAMIYVLAHNWFGRNAAVFAGLIFLFSPLAWFHGTVALTYVVETFFSALTGYLCWRIYRGSARCILPGAMVVGMAAGFRPSSLLLLGPLLLFSFRNANRKQAAAAGVVHPHDPDRRRDKLHLISCVAVAGRAVEGDGFQFLGVQLSGPRHGDPGYLFPVFRLRRTTPVPGAVRGFLQRPAENDIHAGLDRAGTVILHVHLSEVREQRLSAGTRSAGLRLDGPVGLNLVREYRLVQSPQVCGDRRLRRCQYHDIRLRSGVLLVRRSPAI
jgi:hypothetical protein